MGTGNEAPPRHRAPRRPREVGKRLKEIMKWWIQEIRELLRRRHVPAIVPVYQRVIRSTPIPVIQYDLECGHSVNVTVAQQGEREKDAGQFQNWLWTSIPCEQCRDIARRAARARWGNK